MSFVPVISTGICAKNKQRDKNNLLVISKSIKAGFRSLKNREPLGENTKKEYFFSLIWVSFINLMVKNWLCVFVESKWLFLFRVLWKYIFMAIKTRRLKGE